MRAARPFSLVSVATHACVSRPVPLLLSAGASEKHPIYDVLWPSLFCWSLTPARADHTPSKTRAPSRRSITAPGARDSRYRPHTVKAGCNIDIQLLVPLPSPRCPKLPQPPSPRQQASADNAEDKPSSRWQAGVNQCAYITLPVFGSMRLPATRPVVGSVPLGRRKSRMCGSGLSEGGRRARLCGLCLSRGGAAARAQSAAGPAGGGQR